MTYTYTGPYLTVAQVMDSGLVQEINRLLLHPLGLALGVETDDLGSTNPKVRFWDYREYPEGMEFGDDLLSGMKAENIASLIEARGVARLADLGYIIQPLPSDTTQLTLRVLEPSQVSMGDVGSDDEGEES
jgi:hypothetical protein